MRDVVFHSRLNFDMCSTWSCKNWLTEEYAIEAENDGKEGAVSKEHFPKGV